MARLSARQFSVIRRRVVTGVLCTALGLVALVAVMVGEHPKAPEHPPRLELEAKEVVESAQLPTLAVAPAVPRRPGDREPAPGGEQSDGQASRRVRVINGSNREPVPNVAWTLLDPHLVTLATGSSGELGAFTLPITNPGSTMVLRRHGFAPLEVALDTIDAPQGQEITIELAAGGRIAGTVSLPSNRPPESRCTVLALRSDRLIDVPSDAVLAIRGDPRTLLAPVTDGYFEFDEVDGTASYELTAGGSGLVSTGDPVAAHAGDTAIRLTLSPVYAVRIELTDDDGQPIGLGSPDAFAFPGVSIDLSSTTTLSTLTRSGTRLALADVALPDDVLHAGSDRYVVTHVFTADTDVDSLGPIISLIEVPGFLPCRSEVRAYRMCGGMFRTNQVSLKPVSGRPLGSLSLRLANAAAGADGAHAGRRAGQFVPFLLVDIVPARPWIDRWSVKARIWQPDTAPTRVRGLPPGDYTLHINSALKQNGVRAPPSRFSVDSGAEARVDVALPPNGAVEVLPQDALGRPYRGALALTVHSATPAPRQDDDVIGFSGPPYRVAGLKPGDYDIGVAVDWNVGIQRQPPSVRATVPDGRVVSVVVDTGMR